METLAGFLSALARGFRGLLDLASMAVGAAPAAHVLRSSVDSGSLVGHGDCDMDEPDLPSWALQATDGSEHSIIFRRAVGSPLD